MLSTALLINFLIACLVIFVIWLVLKAIVKRMDPPTNGYGWVVDIIALVAVVLCLIFLLSGKRSIDVSQEEPAPHDPRVVTVVALGPPPAHHPQPML